jgi:hypothetical protein
MNSNTDWKSLFVRQYKKFLQKRLYERFLSLQKTSQFNELSNIIDINPLKELLNSKTCQICKQSNSSYHSSYASPVINSPIYSICQSDILQHTLSPDCNYSGPLGELTNSFTVETISSMIPRLSVQSSASSLANPSESSPITIAYPNSFKNEVIIKWN